MSEFQFIHFLAVDRELDEDQFAFMRKQSTRAEITRREFRNDYHFGDFRGNTEEMLRRGFDLHLHYADFGIRKLMIRLPNGLPCSRNAFRRFQIKHYLEWLPDKSGPAGILSIQPEGDAGTFENDDLEPELVLEHIRVVRNLLMDGDLRPLYVGWLACAYEPDAIEPPVPTGLCDLPKQVRRMAEFLSINEDLLAAAADVSPPCPARHDTAEKLVAWINKQPVTLLRSIVAECFNGSAITARADAVAKLRAESGDGEWPTVEGGRTLAQLQDLMVEEQSRRQQREEAAAAARRKNHLKQVASDPNGTVARAIELARQRSGPSYTEAVQLLTDVCEALGAKAGSALARTAALQLHQELPRAYQLIRELRECGLLPPKSAKTK